MSAIVPRRRRENSEAASHEAKVALRRRVAPHWQAAPLTDLAARITASVLELPELAEVECVAGYVALSDELPVEGLLTALHRQGRWLLLPQSSADGTLQWRRWRPTEPLVKGRGGVLEPIAGDTVPLTEAGFVLVPGRAFDRQGRRLGRGGGSYDGALRESTARTCGLAIDAAVVGSVPVAAHDQAVDLVVTPTRVWRTSGAHG